jgi:UDP-N-acetylmuramyl tripeptide synthase
MGSRTVLRNRRVEVAILETARGGILRRGLAVRRADVALVTNVAEDHFGEWGIHDLRGIAETKLVTGRVARRLIVNADDPVLVETLRAEQARRRITADVGLFTLEPGNPVVQAHLRRGGTAAALENGRLVFRRGTRHWPVLSAAEAPVTLGGVARYNIANALGALLVASALGIPRDAIVRGLRDFRGTPRENPGRSHLFEIGGARVVVDFAHNPHGMRALVDMARALPARRRLVVLGQAGDRDDDNIRALARETWPWHPDRVILKEMPTYLRGRRPGEATGLIRDEFLRLGAEPDRFVHADSELDAVRLALAEAGPGDLVLLPVHAQREEVLALMERLERDGWVPGAPLPA